MVSISERKLRPDIPPLDELPGGAFPDLPQYITLLEACWQENPEQRPTFESVITSLRAMLESSAASQKQQRIARGPDVQARPSARPPTAGEPAKPAPVEPAAPSPDEAPAGGALTTFSVVQAGNGILNAFSSRFAFCNLSATEHFRHRVGDSGAGLGSFARRVFWDITQKPSSYSAASVRSQCGD